MFFSTNPYVAGNPVGDSPAFVGRADVLREVLQVLRHPKENAIVLYGQRRIGKTSVLQELEAKLPKQGNYYPIFFDLQDKAQWPLARVLCELSQKISDRLGQTTPNLGDDPETTFRQWLPELLNHLSQEASLVFLFDEFDVLDDPESEKAAATFFPYLRDLLTINQKHLNFVFVIGRKVDDLTNIALSLFKTTPAVRVSLLNQQDTIELIRLSETNNSLIWVNAIETVWQLTGGHPFLTQRLCSWIWERLYTDDPTETPSVTPEEIEAAIPDTLSSSSNALEWLWSGLPPVERMIVSALASAGAKPVPKNQLEGLLRESGIQFVIQELQTLQDWDLIEFVEEGYCFRVELLRRWIADDKPLTQVRKELDKIKPNHEFKKLQTQLHRLIEEKNYSAALKLLDQMIREFPEHAQELNAKHKQLTQTIQNQSTLKALQNTLQYNDDQESLKNFVTQVIDCLMSYSKKIILDLPQLKTEYEKVLSQQKTEHVTLLSQTPKQQTRLRRIVVALLVSNILIAFAGIVSYQVGYQAGYQEADYPVIQTTNEQIYYDVIAVKEGDVLYIRKQPGTNAVGEIPRNGKCVLYLDKSDYVKSQKWLLVQYQGKQGWVNSYHLKEHGSEENQVCQE